GLRKAFSGYWRIPEKEQPAIPQGLGCDGRQHSIAEGMSAVWEVSANYSLEKNIFQCLHELKLLRRRISGF
ncbi:hypothetical protein NPIL_101101, partial [Nephila pilipes]